MINEPVEVTLLVTRQLEALEIPYLIGGSVASIIHGEYRATNAADLLADVRSPHVAPLVMALSPAFFIQAEDLRDAIRHAAQKRTNPRVRPSFAILHKATASRSTCFCSVGAHSSGPNSPGACTRSWRSILSSRRMWRPPKI